MCNVPEYFDIFETCSETSIQTSTDLLQSQHDMDTDAKEQKESEKSSEESDNVTNSKVIVKSGKSSEDSVANEKSSKEKSGCSTAKKHWRCYHCWTNLESEKAICRYCQDKTIFEPT